jgi:hypothetical protein
MPALAMSCVVPAEQLFLAAGIMQAFEAISRTSVFNG